MACRTINHGFQLAATHPRVRVPDGGPALWAVRQANPRDVANRGAALALQAAADGGGGAALRPLSIKPAGSAGGAAGNIIDLDETGWREGKQRAWLWTAVTLSLTAFLVDRGRGATALVALVGESFAGPVGSDRWSVYGRFPTERLLTIAATCRQQGRRLLDTLVDAGKQYFKERLRPPCSRHDSGGNLNAYDDPSQRSRPSLHHHPPRWHAYRFRPSSSRLVGGRVCGARPAPLRVGEAFGPAATSSS